jgi:predicted Zn-dependent peptidase
MKNGRIKTGCEGTRRMYDTARFQQYALSNDIKVWLQEKTIQVSDKGILVACLPNVGSISDPEGLSGLAHFLEHMPFRGTKKYPPNQFGKNLVEEKGGCVDASTSRECINFSVGLCKEDFEFAAELLHDFLDNPLLREEDVESERAVILREYAERESDCEYVRMKDVSKALFGEHPYSKFPGGEKNAIENIRQNDLRIFHDENFCAENIQIICGGSFSYRDDVLDILEKTFGKISNGRKNNEVASPIGILKKHTKIVLERDYYRSDIMEIMYPLSPKDISNRYALRFLWTALSDGTSSPLILELREKRGLVYSTNLTQMSAYSQLIFLTMNCPTTKKDFSLVESVFYDSLRNLEEEYLVKQMRRWQLERKCFFKSPVDTCKDADDEIVTIGKIESFDEYNSAIDAIRWEDIFYWRDYLLNTKPIIVECL